MIILTIHLSGVMKVIMNVEPFPYCIRVREWSVEGKDPYSERHDILQHLQCYRSPGLTGQSTSYPLYSLMYSPPPNHRVLKTNFIIYSIISCSIMRTELYNG